MSLREQIVAEALLWERTPYHPHASVLGAGVDCAMFPLAVYRKFNLLEDVEVPHYSPQWHLHHSEELYLRHIGEVGGVAVPEPKLGDFAVFRFGRTYSHGAIVIGFPEIIHAVMGQGVVRGNLLRDAMLKRKPVLYFTVEALRGVV